MCECIDSVNEAFEKAGQAQEVACTISLGGKPSRVIVATDRTKPRARVSRLLATYCPFCGKKYEEAGVGIEQDDDRVEGSEV